MTTDNNILLDEKTMAERLSVSQRTLRYWRSQKVVPFFKIKNVIRFCPTRVMEALGAFHREAIA